MTSPAYPDFNWSSSDCSTVCTLDCVVPVLPVLVCVVPGIGWAVLRDFGEDLEGSVVNSFSSWGSGKIKRQYFFVGPVFFMRVRDSLMTQ